jgi:hypothetical protein
LIIYKYGKCKIPLVARPQNSYGYPAPFYEATSTGYKNGLDDPLKFRSISDKYLSTKEVDDLPNPMQLSSDYKALDWITPVPSCEDR